ncbi:ASCH domain-containing protein [Acinetobacter beijerinckii]|uniref:Morphogenetic protein n=1 Tax=Acinetobacter beijerinckii ANC 3835 TaxID=1217649 RepID=N9FEL1_9GAMM|nr:hypothetical protein [Acinetobacter beijerinckii]ENW05720.1 hypothetical protein F934_01077 [Acinetobacter beijerinckii ANC 3835]
MKERPILFSTPMVQALIEARKTQTRRVVKSELIIDQAEFESGNRPHVIRSEPSLQYWIENGCPFGQIGDQLWVRETWHVEPDVEGWSMNDNEPCTGWIGYKAGGSKEVTAPNFDAVQRCFPKGEVDWDFLPNDWRPSIFMPRWASRIQLEIMNIRIERLNDISEDDAKAEGMIADDDYCAEEYFSKLWNEINGWDEKGWNANPWVWVIEFKVIQGDKHE